LAMSASTAAKSNAFMKPLITRCASLSDRAGRAPHVEMNGAPASGQSHKKDPIPRLPKQRRNSGGSV
jgi:hypothetical protein